MLTNYHTVAAMQQDLYLEKQNGHKIGFVPTMGALHAGHISLIEKSNHSGLKTVCSIFVNPTQFNDPEDYKKYPRDINSDALLLKNAGCDMLFLPDENEVYPGGKYKQIDFDPGQLGQVLEGAFRPGHFAGMASVVKRLFEIVSPDFAFFGQKDYQQCLIVKEMVKHFQLPLEIVMCPIIRESNGLAMSSRNARLSEAEREQAGLIYETLIWAKHQINTKELSFEAIKQVAHQRLTQYGNFKPEYFDICSAGTLVSATGRGDNPLVILTAVWVGNVRLIDNVMVD